MEKTYTSMQEVREDLKILRLQRDISLAELESDKLELEDTLSVSAIWSTVFSALQKYGLYYLFRKLF